MNTNVSHLSPATGRAAKSGVIRILLVAATIGATLLAFSQALENMVPSWIGTSRYAYAIPLLAFASFIAYRRRSELASQPTGGSWAGFALVLVGLLCNLVGRLGSVYTLQQIGLVGTLAGVALAAGGTRGMKVFGLPLLALAVAIPWPNFLMARVVAAMQSASTNVALAALRPMQVAVYSDKGAIEMAGQVLAIEELRAGLYMLPMLIAVTLVLTVALWPRRWGRLLILLAVIPPALVLVNALWIALICLSFDRDAAELARWCLEVKSFAVTASTALFLGLLAAALGGSGIWRSVPEGRSSAGALYRHGFGRASLTACCVVLVAAAVMVMLPRQPAVIPARPSVAGFPMSLGAWNGIRGQLEPVHSDALRLSDYVLADYRQGTAPPVNLYIAWYDQQEAGRSAHSPSVCLPGDGWVIESLTQVVLPAAAGGRAPLRVNRMVIARDGKRSLLYYWFQQRGRVLTNEYVVKWFLFWDSLVRNRTDGSLVRFMTRVPPGSAIETADERLQGFSQEAVPEVRRYLPD